MNSEYYEMFEDLKEKLGEHHVEEVSIMMDFLKPYHDAREREYDRSFAKRGLVGIWNNLGRKFDAIDNLGKKAEMKTVVCMDHLIDLSLYALKFVVAIRKMDEEGREAFDTWVENVYCPAVGIDADDFEWDI